MKHIPCAPCKTQLCIPLAPKSSPVMWNWPRSLCPGSKSFQFSESALVKCRHCKFKPAPAYVTAVPGARGLFQTCRDPFSYTVTQLSATTLGLRSQSFKELSSQSLLASLFKYNSFACSKIL